MVIKVAVPHQFKLKTLFFVDRKDIHYIGGSDILPAPLEAAAEKKAIKDLGTEKDENARKKRRVTAQAYYNKFGFPVK